MDLVSLLWLRLFSLGDVGRAALRWKARHRSLPCEPHAGSVLRFAGARTGHGAEPNAIRVLATATGRAGDRPASRLALAISDLRRRSVNHRPVERVVRVAQRRWTTHGQHVRHHRDDGPRDLS